MVGGAYRWGRESYPKQNAADDVSRLLATREQRFLSLARETIYGVPKSPYLQLLEHAGCSYGDLAAAVNRKGLEATLERLAEEGVYVTHDEMKGRGPLRRGSAVFEFAGSDFDNPLVTPHLVQRTSGSTGASTSVNISFLHFKEQLPHTTLSAAFHELNGARAALWVPPSEWSVSRVMRLSKTLGGVDRWFSQLPLAVPQRVLTGGLAALLRPHGLRIPAPIHVPITEPETVVQWMAAELRAGRRVLLTTYPASAARLCSSAMRLGISLKGAVLLAGGEPVTPAKRQVMESAGARCLPLFGCSETGESAEACLSPSSSDDMHLYEHKFALIARHHQLTPDCSVDTPAFTSLGRYSPKIFLNGDTGDVGVVERRDCGCPWGRLGFRTHLRDVWSYSKLTAEGMTLPGELVFQALEEELPRQFGGRPGDYQLIAEQDQDGVTRYLLAINPELGHIDEDAAREALQTTLASGSYRLMAEFLKRAGHLQVVRRTPVVQPGGKSLPVFLRRDTASRPG